MKTHTYLGKLRVRIGEYENNVSYLVLANSEQAAWQEFEKLAASYYGDGEQPREDEGYYANGGEIHVQALALRPIGLSSYLDLQGQLPEWRAANVAAPGLAMLEGSVQTAATVLREALASQLGTPVPQSAMLHALAASWGEKNWQVLKAKVAAPDRAAMKAILAAAQAVVDQADDTGCSDDLTVTSSQAVATLSGLLNQHAP
jgi:hypothetical protein